MDATPRQLLKTERARLLRARDAIAHDLLDEESEGESSGELAAIDQHQADVGTEAFEREKELSILAQVNADLRDVDDAFRRLDEGTYGRCQTCGNPIGHDRLAALPAARFCDEHQRVWELSRITLSMPDGKGSSLRGSRARGGSGGDVHDLSFLPTDDEVVQDVELSVEELAMHVDDGRLTAEALELAEARETALAEAEHTVADRDADEWRTEVLAVEDEEDSLDSRS